MDEDQFYGEEDAETTSQELEDQPGQNDSPSEKPSAPASYFKKKLAKKEDELKSLADEKERLAKEIESLKEGQGKTANDLETIKLQNMGFDDNDIKVLNALAVGSGKSPSEMLEDDTFKVYQEGKSSKGRKEKAIPEPSSRVQVVGDKTFNELEHNEKKANYTKTFDTLVNKARNTNRNIT